MIEQTYSITSAAERIEELEKENYLQYKVHPPAEPAPFCPVPP